MQSFLGIAGLLLIAWIASENRKAIPWRAISWLLERAMGVGGVVGLSTAANVFVGMVEAPLFVRPWLARVSRGELFAIMVGGMASRARNCWSTSSRC